MIVPTIMQTAEVVTQPIRGAARVIATAEVVRATAATVAAVQPTGRLRMDVRGIAIVRTREKIRSGISRSPPNVRTAIVRPGLREAIRQPKGTAGAIRMIEARHSIQGLKGSKLRRGSRLLNNSSEDRKDPVVISVRSHRPRVITGRRRRHEVLLSKANDATSIASGTGSAA